jgi:hypothetical protein
VMKMFSRPCGLMLANETLVQVLARGGRRWGWTRMETVCVAHRVVAMHSQELQAHAAVMSTRTVATCIQGLVTPHLPCC